MGLENVDPTHFVPTKGKVFDTNYSMSGKISHFSLTSSKTAQNPSLPQLCGSKRKAEDNPSHGADSKRSLKEATPSITPAGRSPTRKRAGLLSRRRAIGTPVRRIDPPASSRNGLSLNAALAGTTAVQQRKKATKKDWHFEIYEDTPDEFNMNMMLHDTQTSFHISDDESDASERRNSKLSREDNSNKENEPPVGYQTPINRTISRRDMMTEKVRTPLGDLDAKEFYADGCDENSVAVIPADDDHKSSNTKVPFSKEANMSSNILPKGRGVRHDRGEWENLFADLSAKKDEQLYGDDDHEEPKKEVEDFQIWESESAKAEDDATQHIDVASTSKE